MPLLRMMMRCLVVTLAALLAGSGVASAHMQPFDVCLKGTQYDAAITRDMTEGTGFSVNGTPTFFVGKTTAQGFEGFRIVGAQPYAVFQQRIDQLLK